MLMHTYHNVSDPKTQALRFSIALAELGYTSEVVPGDGWAGFRVVAEDGRMVDFRS